MAKFKDVDDYIIRSVIDAHPLLQELRKLIKATVPKAEEGISWNVPFYKYQGALAGFATYKNHVSFGIANGVLDGKDREALEKKGYVTGLKTIQIKFDQKVPVTILKRILTSQAKMNEAKKAARKK